MCFSVIAEFEEFSYNKTKNPAPLDSTPAAGRISDITPLRRCAILTECFSVIGKFEELSYNRKKAL